MELYTWEYEGKQEWGFKDPTPYALRPGFAIFYIRYDEKNNYHRRYSHQITNLRPAKVVDKDAKVMLDFTRDEFRSRLMAITDNLLKKEPLLHFADALYEMLFSPTKPVVTEPKGFGAIVEAGWYNIQKGIEPKGRFFFNGKDWILEGTLYNFVWRDLINPTILSEGLK